MLARLNDNWSLLNPWRTVNGLQKELLGLFDDFNENLNRYRAGYPQMTIEDGAKELIVRMSLPGYEAKDMDIEVVSDFLTIRAERTSPPLKNGEKFLHRERSFGKIEESIKLPSKVKSGKAVAKYINGILIITLPKEEVEKPHIIKIG
jgi:HSP20 family protein